MELLSARETLALMREGMSPVEHAEEVLARIEEWEPRVRAYLSLRPRNEILAEAREAERRYREGRARPLEGLLVAVKDNIVTRCLPTTAASRFLEGFKPGYVATVVERLRGLGAIIVGKTNMDEFAMGSTTENSAFYPTRNPLDTDRVPGGSSGGSAAALAYGGADLALGSDTGGSIRLPAAYTGLYGLKPTYGMVSRYGLIPYANSLEQIGSMARTAGDLDMLFSAIGAPDARDATSYFRPGRAVAGGMCVLRELSEDVGAGVARVLDRFVQELREHNIRIEWVRVPELRGALAAYYTIAVAEAASNLARYDGGLYKCRRLPREPRDWWDLVELSRTECFGSEVKRRILMGVYVLSRSYRWEGYIKATRLRRRIRDAILRLSRRCLLLSPTSPEPPPRLGEKSRDPYSMYLLDLDTVTANLAGVPAVSFPAGTSGGLPVGLQLMGPPGSDRGLIAFLESLGMGDRPESPPGGGVER